MAAIAASQEHSVRKTGSPTHVPDHDVCRLSYYLHCCTVACGVDIIVDELVDFKRAHLLPESRQDSIFKLAAGQFKASEMIEKTIFLDSTGELCGDNWNMFIELKKVTNVLAVSSSALIAGNETEVSKIMVFRPRWLRENYSEPLERRQEQDALSSIQFLARELQKIVVEDLTDTDSLHCAHCRGMDATCGCEHGCEPKETTRCSAVHHCDHCKGFEGGACSCENGCPPSKYSKCVVVHTSVICDSCRVDAIQGPRYKCQKCFNYDLCEDCYRAGRHELTHPFSVISRVGARPIPLRSRQQPRANIGYAKSSARAKVAQSAAAHRIPTASNGDRGGAFFVGDHMSIAEMKQYLEENGASCNGVLEKRQLLRLVWEMQVESMGAQELDSFIAAQGIEGALGNSVGARRRAVIAAFESRQRPRTETEPSGRFHPGDVVELCGLKKESMNGKLATVVRSELVNGRMQVQLMDDAKVRLNIRPVNVRAGSEDID